MQKRGTAMKSRIRDTLSGDGRDVFPLFEEGADESAAEGRERSRTANAGGVGKPPACLARSTTRKSTANNAPGTLTSVRVISPSLKRGKSRLPILYCRLGGLLTVLMICMSTVASAEQSAGATGDCPYLAKVRECIETLMQHGTDRYGKTKTPLLVSILDVETRTCPADPKPLDEAWRVARRERRNPAGANLLTDQPTLKAMYALSAITAKADYATFANRYAAYVMANLVDEQGFFWWGWHRHYDVFKDSREGHNPNRAKWGAKVFPHEIHAINSIAWDRLWAVNKDAVTKAVEAIWEWHVINKKSGEINRHGDGNKGCDFTMSGGAYIEAFAFMYSQTKEQKWLDRAKLIANYYWGKRDLKTHLLPERPNAGKKRFDGACFVTANAGLYCHALFKAYALTGEKSFCEQAVAYLKAYATYGYDEKTGKFWGALKMDGKPIPGPRVSKGYAQYEPRGHLDLWEPYVAGYQYAIYTAQVYAHAYQLTQEPIFLKTAERFAAWIKKTPPGTVESENTWYDHYAKGPGEKGTYAGKYGRTISFFLHLYIATGEKKYLDDARTTADKAIEKLYHNGLFRGHPAKPYYEAMDGVGYLLYALLSLDQVLKDPQEAVKSKAILIGNDKRKLALDNW